MEIREWGKLFTANAYGNILVFYKPLAPSTRTLRLIQPEGPAAVLLIAWWFSIPLRLVSVRRELESAVQEETSIGQNDSPHTPNSIQPKPWESPALGRAVTAKELREACDRLLLSHQSTALWVVASCPCMSPPKFQGSSHGAQAHMHRGCEAVSGILSSPLGSHNGERRRNS